ncbi:hypothetical protein EBZ39_19070 [bacterium]|nr:hypothetical protein [bacterium]
MSNALWKVFVGCVCCKGCVGCVGCVCCKGCVGCVGCVGFVGCVGCLGLSLLICSILFSSCLMLSSFEIVTSYNFSWVKNESQQHLDFLCCLKKAIGCVYDPFLHPRHIASVYLLSLLV